MSRRRGAPRWRRSGTAATVFVGWLAGGLAVLASVGCGDSEAPAAHDGAGGNGGAAGDGGSTDDGAAADATLPDVRLPEPSCASVALDGADGVVGLRPSNTLRLAGPAASMCGGDLEVRVRIGERDLPPVTLDTVPEAERFGLDLATTPGHWHLSANLWCAERDGFDRRGLHVVHTSLVDRMTSEEITFDERVVRFSGIDDDTTWIPFVPGAARAPGSEAAAKGPEPERRVHHVTALVDGAARDFPYEVTLPPDYDPAKPRAALLLMHGWSRNADDYLGFPDGTGMRTAALAKGLVLISPQGHWYDAGASIGAWGCLKRQCEIREGGNWYSPVLRAIVADVLDRYSLDTRRISVAGFSCGASYAYCLAVNFPGKFASAIVMDGNQAPITTTIFGPYGYFPNDQIRRIPITIVAGAARKDWGARFGSGARISGPWCMNTTYHDTGSSSHAWFPEYNDAIVDLAASAEVE